MQVWEKRVLNPSPKLCGEEEDEEKREDEAGRQLEDEAEDRRKDESQEF